MTIKRFLIGFGLVLIITLVGWLALSRKAPHPHLSDTWGEVQVMAHQGGDRLWPSNTLHAFERAAELGVDVLELDVHASNDGYLVAIHDDTLDRTTDGAGQVKEKSLFELQQLDAGYAWSPERTEESFPYRGRGVSIPTLDEVFRAFPRYRMNIEIKQQEPSITQPLCDLIRFHGKDLEVMVVSFHDPAIKDFRRRCPEVATAASPAEVRSFYILNRLYLGALARPAAEAMQVPEYQGDLEIVTESFINAAHRKNVQVHVWTVDDVAAMERLIALGVDGIITDRPDRLLNILDRGEGVTLPEGIPD